MLSCARVCLFCLRVASCPFVFHLWLSRQPANKLPQRAFTQVPGRISARNDLPLVSQLSVQTALFLSINFCIGYSLKFSCNVNPQSLKGSVPGKSFLSSQRREKKKAGDKQKKKLWSLTHIFLDRSFWPFLGSNKKLLGCNPWHKTH